MMETFERHRGHLFNIAYRMLGSVMDAEDALQECFLRWQAVDPATVANPRAFLTTVISRLCIDQLRRAQRVREEYIGPWLPEPLLTDRQPGVAETVELADSLSMAFLTLLERLSPAERAALLLHDVFGYSYDDVSAIIGKKPANCRQLVRRGRQRLAAGRPRFHASPEAQTRLFERFASACSTGDLGALSDVLAADVVAWSDGGGRVAAARRPIAGRDAVARFVLGLLRQAPPDLALRPGEVNGEPAVIATAGGQPFSVLVLEMSDEAIQTLRFVVNPEKLAAISRDAPIG